VTTVRVALANLSYPASPEAAVVAAERAIADAGRRGASIVCFPECFVPGYRWPGRNVPPHDPAFHEAAWATVSAAARRARVAVILGTERKVDGDLRITALVVGPDGEVLGWQDKVQLDPGEDGTFRPGAGRHVFQVGPLTFGVVICHEGWRYPETVRLAVRRGAQIVFHPHYGEAEPGEHRPVRFGDPENTFHERAILCRAAENTCWFASVNCAGDGAPTTSAIARPDGTLHAFQPHGEAGLLVADLDLSLATGLLASRLRTE
jgi:predicted amidohydrolase